MMNNGNEGTLQENVALNNNVRLPRKIRKPLAFQSLGEAIWEDMEPQSHRAQHPWLLAHSPESINTVKEVMQSIIDPKVINLVMKLTLLIIVLIVIAPKYPPHLER